ncbi:hypothetical protein [Streptomyces sp. NPDC096013]|uniref:hypothetical protein n=1 Tax=Streptomyces sp. NPDC096013 TaxID=3366069 RepID=UPI003828DD74
MSNAQLWEELLAQLDEQPQDASWHLFRTALNAFYRVAEEQKDLSLRELEKRARRINSAGPAFSTWGLVVKAPRPGAEVTRPEWKRVELLVQVWAKDFKYNAGRTRELLADWAHAYRQCGGDPGPDWPPRPDRNVVPLRAESGEEEPSPAPAPVIGEVHKGSQRKGAAPGPGERSSGRLRGGAASARSPGLNEPRSRRQPVSRGDGLEDEAFVPIRGDLVPEGQRTSTGRRPIALSAAISLFCVIAATFFSFTEFETFQDSGSRVTRVSGDSVIHSHDGSGTVSLYSCAGLPDVSCKVLYHLRDRTVVTMDCWIDAADDHRWFLVTVGVDANASHRTRSGFVSSADIPEKEQIRTPQCSNAIIDSPTTLEPSPIGRRPTPSLNPL